jgi:hypothetical protein
MPDDGERSPDVRHPAGDATAFKRPQPVLSPDVGRFGQQTLWPTVSVKNVRVEGRRASD